MKKQDIEDLRELIEFLKQHGVAEFDVDRGDLKIRLKFNPPGGRAGRAAASWRSCLRAAPPGADAGCCASGAAGSGCSRCASSLPTPMPDCTW